MAVRGDAADLVKQAGAGFCCPPEDPGAIAECVERLYKMTRKQREILGKNGREFYQKHLSFHNGVDRFETVFQSVRQGTREK
jgi:glycosyltransferase involved in cell wall biosynthesis